MSGMLEGVLRGLQHPDWLAVAEKQHQFTKLIVMFFFFLFTFQTFINKYLCFAFVMKKNV